MRKIIVNKKFDNKKVLYCIEENFPNLSYNMLNKALRKKDIRINDVKISDNVTVHENDEIKIYIADTYLFGTDFKPDIIYEDKNILVVNKKKGIEVTGENSLEDLLKVNFPDIFPCHRLDRNTEGLVVFAKSKEALDIILKKFKNHEISKSF